MLAMGISLTLGFATLVVGELNALSMIFVVLFFGLGVDFAAAALYPPGAGESRSKIGVALSQALRTGPAAGAVHADLCCEFSGVFCRQPIEAWPNWV